MSPKRGGERLIAAFFNSLRGLKVCFQKEEAFREELALLSVSVPVAFYVGETGVERILLIGSVALIPILETLNSAVEAVVDLTTDKFHPLAGYAKDIASASVLLAIFLALFVWGTILWS